MNLNNIVSTEICKDLAAQLAVTHPDLKLGIVNLNLSVEIEGFDMYSGTEELQKHTLKLNLEKMLNIIDKVIGERVADSEKRMNERIRGPLMTGIPVKGIH